MSGSDQIANMTVSAVLDQWPQTADVFNQFNMACVGCPVAPYYTVTEAAKVYKLSVDEFVAVLEKTSKENQS
jgi:hybrid cluster-associated redox disulfide protein